MEDTGLRMDFQPLVERGRTGKLPKPLKRHFMETESCSCWIVAPLGISGGTFLRRPRPLRKPPKSITFSWEQAIPILYTVLRMETMNGFFPIHGFN